ncbi:MAG: hypothetical protein EBX50_02410 [Chitinophagia bacterium]|nr:hypothetical protein [Chitinophagia bacterium]
MLRKFLFLIITCIAFQQLITSAKFSAFTSICNNEIVGVFQSPSIHESYPLLTDLYWEEDELDRFNWEKKTVRTESNLQQNFSLSICADGLPNAQISSLSAILPIPIYLYNSNLRI